jgi:hypothetical protein
MCEWQAVSTGSMSRQYEQAASTGSINWQHEQAVYTGSTNKQYQQAVSTGSSTLWPFFRWSEEIISACFACENET